MIGGIEDADRRRLFTQRLFNRLMFVAFVQKKEWLRLNGQTDYLNELWKSYQQTPTATASTTAGSRISSSSRSITRPVSDYMRANGASLLSGILGDVRYLNGGLFEQERGRPERSRSWCRTRPSRRSCKDLFNRFNFTVTESTPLDMEVAVDPEMLGKVFEELVTGRHETGSYYTPKPIVSFMCREALKAYLRSGLPDEAAGRHRALRRRARAGRAARSRSHSRQRCARHGLRPCLWLRGAICWACCTNWSSCGVASSVSRQVDPVSDYRRKLEIIQNNVYGVDIDPFAINIARLRLWLSLAIEYEGDRPEPLPNLDFKIEVGDSLTARHFGADGQLALRQKPVEDFQQLKATFLTAHGDDKRRLYADIQVAKKKLADLTHGGATVHGFDWPVEFAEVFADGGFDVVLANPPYVRQELIKDIKPRLQGSLRPAIQRYS